jgi:hypothetical protein
MISRTLEMGVYGSWIRELTNDEAFVHMRGMVGSAHSKIVRLYADDVKEMGGKEKLSEILQSMLDKAERLKPYEDTYGKIFDMVLRIKKKFKLQ